MVKRGYVSGSESTEKRKRETWSSLSLPCEDEKAATCTPGRERSPQAEHIGALILASRLHNSENIKRTVLSPSG